MSRTVTGAGGRLLETSIGQLRGMTAGDLVDFFKSAGIITGADLVIPSGDGVRYVVRATYTGSPGINARVELDTVIEVAS